MRKLRLSLFLAYETYTIMKGDVIMKLTDMLVNYIIKGGLISESRNIDVEMKIPDSNMIIKIKCDHMTIRVEKA